MKTLSVEDAMLEAKKIQLEYDARCCFCVTNVSHSPISHDYNLSLLQVDTAAIALELLRRRK